MAYLAKLFHSKFPAKIFVPLVVTDVGPDVVMPLFTAVHEAPLFVDKYTPLP